MTSPPARGGSVKVTASQNSGSSARSGSLTVKTASGLTKSVSISQEKAPVYFYIKQGSFITFENYYENLTRATANCSVYYNNKKYPIFTSTDVLNNRTPTLDSDVRIEFIEGVTTISFEMGLSMSTPSGTSGDQSTNFFVYADGSTWEEIGSPNNPFNGAVVSSQFGSFTVNKNDEISLEFYYSVSKI